MLQQIKNSKKFKILKSLDLKIVVTEKIQNLLLVIQVQQFMRLQYLTYSSNQFGYKAKE